MMQKRDLSVKVKKRFNTVQWGILTKYSVFSTKVVYSKWEIGRWECFRISKKAVTHHSEDDHPVPLVDMRSKVVVEGSLSWGRGD